MPQPSRSATPAHAAISILILQAALAAPAGGADAIGTTTALLDRLEPIALEGPAAEGLTATRKVHRIESPPALRIDIAVENRGEARRSLEDLPILEATLRPAPADDLRYRALEHRQDIWYGSTYWTGPDWTRVGRDWHHPGEKTPSVRRFTAPRDGRAVLRGRVFKAHLDGDGVRAEIRHRGRTIWSAEIDGKDAAGREHEIPLDLQAGETVRFVVEKRGTIVCDTTRWDPAIEYEGGETFLASAGFSGRAQGEGGWSYEMDVAGSGRAGTGAGGGEPAPRALTFDEAWASHESRIGAGEFEGHRASDALPILLLEDEREEGGIVLAGDPRNTWDVRVEKDTAGMLRAAIRLGRRAGRALAAGETAELAPILLAPYRGNPVSGLAVLERWMGEQRLATASGSGDASATGPLGAPLRDILRRLQVERERAGVPELPLWKMVEEDWRRQDGIDPDGLPEYVDPILDQFGKALVLLMDLRGEHGGDFLRSEEAELLRLGGEKVAMIELGRELPQLYTRLRLLKRRIALASPLLDFGRLLFTKRAPTSYSHLVMQYYGWRARPGGGLFTLESPGRSLACRDLLRGRLETGNVLEPSLSFDGKRIVFSYVEVGERAWDPDRISNDDPPTDGFYHIWEVGADGEGLRQLTDGPFDDLMPTHLPDGGIAFVSTRRKGYARCFGAQFSRRWHVYTLHRMEADGSGIRPLSFHDTNEWFPSVSNDGRILYARWDYIDRDAVTHQNLWATRPDGTSPMALWGNATPSPHCAFQARAIPGSHKIIFTASAHHAATGGSLVIVDPSVGPNGEESLERLTPEIPFPEAESRDIREYYESPWPLSESLYLVAYSPQPLAWEPAANPRNALGIYLLDRWGNRELLYRDPEISSTNPCPLRPRPRPPILPAAVPEGAEPLGEMVVADVHEGLGGVPRGTIRELRIVQIFPKLTHVANQPPVGMASEENPRAILGTVPVEADGSARFLVPASKPLLFQALDADGFAYQTMRSVTYVQPGERVSCVGCHERPMSPPARGGERGTVEDLLALRRAPSAIDPGALGGRPFSYVEVVQPVLDRRCVSCHGGERRDGGIDLTGEPQGDYTRSYISLCGDVSFWEGGTRPENAAKALVPRFGGRNPIQVTPPGGAYGARGSRLLKLLREGHADVRLEDEEMRRLAAWIDLNAIFYGSCLPEEQARQRRGEVLQMPAIQ